MTSKPPLEPPPSSRNQRLAAIYAVSGTEAEARTQAQLICIDQTVEASDEVLTPAIRRRIVGQVEEIRPLEAGRHAVTVTFAADLAGRDCTGLLNVLFGTSSLRPGVRLLSWDFPRDVAAGWRGPRFGITGLRTACRVADRALVCAVLKPLGLSPQDLADLARRFVLGGVDLVKDDQGLMDHSFCPFDERVGRCAEAVAQAAVERGRPCLYLPHVSGPAEQMVQHSRRAKQAGAGGLLVAPGLTGFDALRLLAEDDRLGLPIASHPSFLGSYALHPDQGLAPAVLYGQLPRLAGADISIYPNPGAGFAMTRVDCAAVAQACRREWHHLPSSFPTAAGRMGFEQVETMGALYGRDVVFILGSRIQQDPRGLIPATGRFIREVERCTGDRTTNDPSERP